MKCKRVFKRKYDKDGDVERCKSWLIARGYSKVERIDYKGTWNKIKVHYKFVCTFSRGKFASSPTWHICSLFEWRIKWNNFYGTSTCKATWETKRKPFFYLKKSLYSIHQSGRKRDICLEDFFKPVKLTRFRADSCTYFNKENHFIITIYLDDLLVVPRKDSTILKI